MQWLKRSVIYYTQPRRKFSTPAAAMLQEMIALALQDLEKTARSLEKSMAK
jgi:hypothetical protein